MGYSDQRSKPRRGFSGGGRGRGNFSSGPREMHKAVCSKCGKDCEVPFAPTGSKPVYCNNCFRKEDDRGQRRPSFSRNQSNPPNNAQLEAISQKLDKILELLNRNFSSLPPVSN